MEFSCSVCGYISCKKDNVVNHINRKKSCGPGIREIVEIPIEIICEFCNKNFLTKQNLTIHIKNHCKHKDSTKDARIKELEEKLRQKAIIHQINDKEDQSYIYLIKIYPFSDNIFKIGRTENIKKRLADYKRYKIVFVTSCINDVQSENEVLKLFRLKFTECKEMGNEYFYGEYQQMKKAMIDYFYNISE